jgi:hypothetical protein
MRFTLRLILTGLFITVWVAAYTQPLQLNQFVLQDTAGNRFNLDSLKGKAVFIEAWFPACPPCRTVAPFTGLLQQRLHTLQADSNIAWVTICFRQSRQDWLAALPHMPQAIHLYAPGSIYEGSLAGGNFPTFRLFTTQGNLETQNLPLPTSYQQLDFLLYAASRNIGLAQAWQMLRLQNGLWPQFQQLWQPHETAFRQAFNQALQHSTR